MYLFLRSNCRNLGMYTLTVPVGNLGDGVFSSCQVHRGFISVDWQKVTRLLAKAGARSTIFQLVLRFEAR